MSPATRVAIAAWLIILTLGVVAGQWPLQGPQVLALTERHGVHLGDVVAFVVTAVACVALLRPRR